MSEHDLCFSPEQFFQTCSVPVSLTLRELFTLFYLLDSSLTAIKALQASSDLDNQQPVIQDLHDKFVGLFHGHGFHPIAFDKGV